jgi:gamma-glutamylcyclotransferase (GGCT)/AIG2-like uncharacterized protein YtfP
LRRGFRTPVHPLLDRHATYCGRGSVRGVLFDLGAYPGLRREDGGKRAVTGELYRLDRPARLLPRLDRYEGCGRHMRRPTEYIREAVPVEPENGAPVRAWVYLYNGPLRGARRIHSGDYRHRR